MASQLTVDNIVGATSASAVHLPGGVVQVVQNIVTTNNYAITTSDYPTATGFTATITPKFATSKILILADIAAWIESGGNTNMNKISKWGLRLNSQSNTIVGDKRSSIYFYGGSGNGHDHGSSVFISYLADPNTTSPQTYEVMFGRWSSTYDNTVILNGGGFGNSSLTLLEIAQ